MEVRWGSRQQSKTEYNQAREGDHLMVPFECNTCIFQKLRNKVGPDLLLTKDKLLMECIRRINLDCFWSRATSTVLGNRDKVRSALRLAETVGLTGPFEHTMGLPTFDHAGYQVAILMVLDSTSAGRYAADHKQWDTVRKIRTVYSNHAKASPQANMNTVAFGDERGRAQRLLSDKCSSYWFSRFFIGCRRRSGQDWRPNKAMSIDLIKAVVEFVDTQRRETQEAERHKWIVFGTYFIVSYTLSLRGVEGLLLDLTGTLQHLGKGDDSFFYILLHGKVKNDTVYKDHVMPCCTITSSGLPVKEWVVSLLEQMANLGLRNGPAIADMQGNVRTCAQMDECFIEALSEIYEVNPDLFPPSIKNVEDIKTGYSVFRSIRRSSDTRALEKNVSQTDIAMVNRWSEIQRAKGNKPTGTMYQYYAQLELLVEPFKRYTFAM